MKRRSSRSRVRLAAVETSKAHSGAGPHIRSSNASIRLGSLLGGVALIGLVIGALAVRSPANAALAGGLPDSVDGLPVLSVSEAIDARSKDDLGAASLAVGGYWSDRATGHSCSAAAAGELEMRCVDGEFGITQNDEPILATDERGELKHATGPALTPWFDPDAAGVDKLFGLPVVNGQRYTPIPIVVVGHFNDARADECQPDVRALCLGRLVVTKVAVFDPNSVATPAPTKPQQTVGSDVGLFDPRDGRVCAGDVTYSFVGWTTTDALELPFQREGRVWAAITAEPALLGGDEWSEDSVGPFRMWGRRICLATQADPNTILYGVVPGTLAREGENGKVEPVADQ
ncbi:MAG: hypothetical protein HYX55_08440 [Chloroflexi bacterium]|nr:hypothetical protein [Chloroflexota bacterium]